MIKLAAVRSTCRAAPLFRIFSRVDGAGLAPGLAGLSWFLAAASCSFSVSISYALSLSMTWFFVQHGYEGFPDPESGDEVFRFIKTTHRIIFRSLFNGFPVISRKRT